MKKIFFIVSSFVLLTTALSAQTSTSKSAAAKRTNASIKIDGKLDEAAWKEGTLITGFVQMAPNFNTPEDPSSRTEVYVLYDNTAMYIGGHCYERSKDSISKELTGRDNEGVNDYIGIILDTYHDKINGSGFYVTVLGSQLDFKYSTTNGEDISWNAVWDSETQITSDGWTFEIRIPYSALRFVSKDNQTWGMNFLRGRKKAGQQLTWNPVDPKVGGFINQEGSLTGIEKIDAPVRLSFSPYFSTYLNHFKQDQKGAKDWTSSFNGGMDVKYGVSDAFTLDVTLIPDFGQVKSDNQILNLSPFEVQYGENRPFFIEGTELFNKGNLFYSRRVGSTPINFGAAYNNLGLNEYVFKNPTESKLINALKLSGRTKKGLGLGLFNAITKPMYATIKDSLTGEKRTVKTGVLTNYNIMVVDQTLKNNSSVSFINLNTIRDDGERDANVSSGLFDFNNKKNTYNWSGKLVVSNVFENDHTTTGYAHNWNFNKNGGRWNFSLGEDLANNKFDPNDLGIQYTNNYIDHFFWTAYRWLKPKKWYNRIQLNYNTYYSRLLAKIPNQQVNTMFQAYSMNINGNVQFKSLWWAGMFIGYVFRGYDFYEPRVEGWAFRTPRRLQLNPWFNSNDTKKYYVSFNYFVGLRSLFNSPNQDFSLNHRYRFNDKFSLRHNIYLNFANNDAGFYGIGSGGEILFTRRDLRTVENNFVIKYSFSNKSGIEFIARHYWSKVHNKQAYELLPDGNLTPYNQSITLNHQNLNVFNIDATYTWQFAPGSFLNIVWKDQSFVFNRDISKNYFRNFDSTLEEPQNNNLSLKIIYYLDYLDFKKWGKKKG